MNQIKYERVKTTVNIVYLIELSPRVYFRFSAEETHRKVITKKLFTRGKNKPRPKL